MKGLEHLLLAVRDLRGRGRPVELELVGEGPLERERLEAAIADLGLVDCVTLSGRTDRQGVVAALNRADLAVLSSLSEGLANSVIEAMAVGVPVVASDVGGIPELVDDGVNGLLTPPRDPGRLADAIERLLDDSALRERLVEAARQRVATAFCIDDQVAAWVDLYRELASLDRNAPAAPPFADSATPAGTGGADASDLPLIVAIGPFGWQGGHDLVLEAAALLVEAGHRFRLVVAGWGRDTTEAGFLRHDLDLEGCVDIRCQPDGDELDRLRRCADVLVALPRVPGTGRGPAASWLGPGRPAVVSDAVALDASYPLVRVVPRRDSAGAAAAIGELLSQVGRAVPSTRAP